LFESHTLVVMLIAIAVAGCTAASRPTASSSPTTTPPPADLVQSGFLSSYASFSGSKDDRLRHDGAGIDLSPYDKVLIDRVHLWRTEATSLDAIDAVELERLADALYFAVREALRPAYTITDRAGPGVMEVHLALTEVQRTDVALDVVSMSAPPHARNSDSTAVGAPLAEFLGAAVIEIEIDDSVSKDVLFAAIERRVGGSSAGLRRWNDIDAAIDATAARLAADLTRLRR
jgi:hypothetical protein